MRSSARRGPGTSSQWKAIAHWQRIDNRLCFGPFTVVDILYLIFSM